MAKRPAEEQEEWGNIALLEHVNINTDDPQQASIFFADALGFERDRRMGKRVGSKLYVHKLLWFNAGITQVHLPMTHRGYGGALRNVWQGTIGLVYGSDRDIDDLCHRLAAAAPRLRRSRFSWQRHRGPRGVDITDPLGNRYVALPRGQSA